jgi:hypothetical protein
MCPSQHRKLFEHPQVLVAEHRSLSCLDLPEFENAFYFRLDVDWNFIKKNELDDFIVIVQEIQLTLYKHKTERLDWNYEENIVNFSKTNELK